MSGSFISLNQIPALVLAAAAPSRVSSLRWTHLQLLLSLQGELFEGLDDDPCVGAVVNENGRAPHPRLQVVDGQRDVLGVVLKKHTTNQSERRHIALLLITHFCRFAFNYWLCIRLMESTSRGWEKWERTKMRTVTEIYHGGHAEGHYTQNLMLNLIPALFALNPSWYPVSAFYYSRNKQ